MEVIKKMVKNKKIEECESEKCCGCRFGHWVFPLAIVILLWSSNALWSKVTITIILALAFLMHFCPCRKNRKIFVKIK